MTECRMVSKAPQYVAPDRRHCYYRYCRKMCYFVLSCLVDRCHWGKYHSLVYGNLSYFICRYIIKSFMLGQPARNTGLSIQSRCSVLFLFFMRKKWLTIYLFMSIFNLEKNHFFLLDFRSDSLSGLVSFSPCFFMYICFCPKTGAINFCHLKSLSYSTVLQLLKHM